MHKHKSKKYSDEAVSQFMDEMTSLGILELNGRRDERGDPEYGPTKAFIMSYYNEFSIHEGKPRLKYPDRDALVLTLVKAVQEKRPDMNAMEVSKKVSLFFPIAKVMVDQIDKQVRNLLVGNEPIA